MAKPYLTHLHL